MNASCIKWAHGVNSVNQLLAALNSSHVDMIEADIVLGYFKNTFEIEPIMAHPPASNSDLTLERFLLDICAHNKIFGNRIKGIKLDFKSIEVFEGSLHILDNTLPKMNCPIWLNGDILPGPVNQTEISPVDADRFFAGCARFPQAVLSIGWTTLWGPNYKDGAYTLQDINNMLDAIKRNNIAAIGNVITFPVRAGIAANSEKELNHLLNNNNASLTIWSSPGDYVEVDKLRDLICSFGPARVYLDLPDSLRNKLHLPDNFNQQVTGSNKILTFGLVIIGVILAGIWLRR